LIDWPGSARWERLPTLGCTFGGGGTGGTRPLFFNWPDGAGRGRGAFRPRLVRCVGFAGRCLLVGGRRFRWCLSIRLRRRRRGGRAEEGSKNARKRRGDGADYRHRDAGDLTE
jgi:hypothetical protein